MAVTTSTQMENAAMVNGRRILSNFDPQTCVARTLVVASRAATVIDAHPRTLAVVN